MSYLLDTNACIAIINGRPQSVRHRLRSVLTRGEPVALSSVALFELWYGVAKSARAAANTERLAVFLAPLETLPFDDDDARAAGAVRTALEHARDCPAKDPARCPRFWAIIDARLAGASVE